MIPAPDPHIQPYGPLLTPEAVAELRAAARAGSPFRRRLVELQADLADAERERHAATADDPEERAAAELRAAAAVGAVERHKDDTADAVLAALSLAAERRPAETADVLRRLLDGPGRPAVAGIVYDVIESLAREAEGADGQG